MTEKELRQKVVDTINAWIGLDRAKGTHKPIIDTYNNHKPLARGYKVTYSDAYCATTVSAAAIKCELTDIIPTECGCGQQIALFQKAGRWVENDAYVPQIGDVIFYDWDDNGVGDCVGWPEHVGVVVKVSGKTLTITEGNLGGKVAQRTIQVNAKNIRGYGIPNYASKASKALEIKVGKKYTLLQNIPWRKTPGGKKVKHCELGSTAKTVSTISCNSKRKKGTTIKPLEVLTKPNGSVHVRLANGWLCVVYKGKCRLK